MGIFQRLKACCDLDSLLTYSTTKVVKVHDRILGSVYLLSFLTIVLYVIFFVLGQQKAYLEVETGVYSLETNYLSNRTNQPLPSELDYCADPPVPPNRLGCLYWNEFDAVYPPTGEMSIALTTRVSEELEIFNETARTYKTVRLTPRLFVADVERFTLRIRHSVQAQTFPGAAFRASSRQMQGFVKAANGSTILEVGNTDDDIFSLGWILEAAGVDLDAMSDFPGSEQESMRYAGINVLMQIFYTNFGVDRADFRNSALQYTYTIRRIERTEFKVYENVYINDTTRLLFNRHGVNIVFTQNAAIGRFSFQLIFVQLASALGLLTVASVALDYMMLNLVPLKDWYKQSKIDVVGIPKAAKAGVTLKNKTLNEKLLDEDVDEEKEETTVRRRTSPTTTS